MNDKLTIFEFHVSKQARIEFGFDDYFFGTNGRVIFTNFQAARQFANQINARRNATQKSEFFVKPGELNALALIEELLHVLIHNYRNQNNIRVMEDALEWLEEKLGRNEVDQALISMVNNFPPTPVFRSKMSAEAYLAGYQHDANNYKLTNRQIALEELLLLWISNSNPAAAPFKDFFDDALIKDQSSYLQIIQLIKDFFDQQPGFGPDNINLIDLLSKPSREVPGSLFGQLDYIRAHWGNLVHTYFPYLLSSLDLIREENRPIFPAGPGPALIPEFDKGSKWQIDEFPFEPERFSPDLDWMPRLVLIAKNSYVWLDQLSKKYHRPITKLNEIPDEILDELSRWGITGLWLIGLWERSPASQKIKQLRGNPEAVASAYSIFSYEIAQDLGGISAFENLRERAWKRGIRLSSDMVPNHMGIDSRWVIEQPDWFISLDQSPFSSYQFNGPDLSWDKRVGIFIEDHYYDSSDAAVVFKRKDYWTGSEKFIYHGNDGTSMPWNDTAQLNYLIPEVREAVIQTILHVARQTPIIRFDAAMTLAKKHYHRLWFPEPGSGGDIPSRAGLGLSKEDFDKAFPTEFWREVVDRVALEQPDTLLLAEAFWLMEGYFVRTLGMHRVYNSAFMNMLRDEMNMEYRSVIKNTLEFDPEILKRYVNFMNNPDERTAVDQFGKGDKYFGICTMMATLPGLPMIGHGQIEGFSEKYGMEYRKAYWDESPDPYLVERHEKEIFPLLRKRSLFSEVENFLFYDFLKLDGSIDEDVFAYSNQKQGNKSLVIYHNRYKHTRGHIKLSVPFAVKSGEEKSLIQKSLGQGLEIPETTNSYLIFRDHKSGLEYLRNCAEIHQVGLYVELNAYDIRVYHNFRIVSDSTQFPYSSLARYLQGGGVENMQEALSELRYAQFLSPFEVLVNAEFLRELIQNRASLRVKPSAEMENVLKESQEKFNDFVDKLSSWYQSFPISNENLETPIPPFSNDLLGIKNQLTQNTLVQLRNTLLLPTIEERFLPSKSKSLQKAIDYLNAYFDLNPFVTGSSKVWSILLCYAFCSNLEDFIHGLASPEPVDNWFEELLFMRQITKTMRNMDLDEWNSKQSSMMVGILLQFRNWFKPDLPVEGQVKQLLTQVIHHKISQVYLGFNVYSNKTWFNKEKFEELTWFLFVMEAIKTFSIGLKDAQKHLISAYQAIELILQLENNSEFQVEQLTTWLNSLESIAQEN
jgi:glycosidase